MDGKMNAGYREGDEDSNPPTNPHFHGAPPPQYSEHPSSYNAPLPQQTVVVMPPPATGGVFLNPDEPIVLQPGLGAMTNTPHSALDYLQSVNKLVIKQKIELIELVTAFETANRYTIYNENGQPVFYAIEESDCCDRFCFGPIRPLQIKIFDLYRNEVININRPLRCQSCCYFCCLQDLEITAPPGALIGNVRQNWSILKPNFSVTDTTGETVLKIRGPVCKFSCGGDVVFKVLSADEEVEVGKISKTWSGFVQEMFTDADNFSISFPRDLDVRVKASLLGALFLIDYMYFEKKKNNNNRGYNYY